MFFKSSFFHHLLLLLASFSFFSFTDSSFDQNRFFQVLIHHPQLIDSCYYGKYNEDDFIDFLSIYDQKPCRGNEEPGTPISDFFLWDIIKHINPYIIVQSGVKNGLSTWIIEQAAPKAKILAFDPSMNQRLYISKNTIYQKKDIKFSRSLKKQAKNSVFLFNDDQNAFDRILLAHNYGCNHVIFENNYVSSDSQNAHASDLSLRSCFELPEHHEKADLLRKIIKKYYIMPNIIGSSALLPRTNLEITNLPCIWENLEEIDLTYRDKMKTFSDHSQYYRWTTYVELY